MCDARTIAARRCWGKVVRPEGIEPPAYRFEACRSIQLSYGRTFGECSMLESLVAPAPFLAGDAIRRPETFSPGPVAQLAEQQTLNLRVDGSIPSRLTTSCG